MSEEERDSGWLAHPFFQAGAFGEAEEVTVLTGGGAGTSDAFPAREDEARPDKATGDRVGRARATNDKVNKRCV